MDHAGNFGRSLVMLVLVLVGLGPVTGWAQSDTEATRVVVRATSQDAKVIQDPVGGARVTIRDVATGRVLARGMQEGGSGSTETIMRQPRERGEAVYQDAAKYVASLQLARPTVVEITAEGPMAYPQAIQQTSKTMLLVPGDHVEGDGVILTLHGFIVELQQPSSSVEVDAGSTIDVHATVRMMCGCPTEPGGMWDANDMDIEARLVRDGTVVRRTSLAYAGQRSNYEGSIQVPEEGAYDLQVVAADAGKVNFGMHGREIRAR